MLHHVPNKSAGGLSVSIWEVDESTRQLYLRLQDDKGFLDLRKRGSSVQHIIHIIGTLS
jgi:hypothetical protein